MKRVSPIRFDDYGPCALYLDDLEKIAKLIGSVSAEVTVKADDYQFDTVNDLTLLNKPAANEVYIEGRDPFVYFEIRPYLSRLYLSDTDDLRLEGVAAAVRAVVERRSVGRKAKDRFLASLRKSTDPEPQRPPGLVERNREYVAAAIGGLVGALATAALTVLLIWLGVLKTGGT